ncbi:MAG: hypothetical protein K0V04_07550 [Deltaproteobacteria bacterium]|nr:hypothetical protein [Deltaproteobacteria bacterium]
MTTQTLLWITLVGTGCAQDESGLELGPREAPWGDVEATTESDTTGDSTPPTVSEGTPTDGPEVEDCQCESYGTWPLPPVLGGESDWTQTIALTDNCHEVAPWCSAQYGCEVGTFACSYSTIVSGSGAPSLRCDQVGESEWRQCKPAP